MSIFHKIKYQTQIKREEKKNGQPVILLFSAFYFSSFRLFIDFVHFTEWVR